MEAHSFLLICLCLFTAVRAGRSREQLNAPNLYPGLICPLNANRDALVLGPDGDVYDRFSRCRSEGFNCARTLTASLLIDVR